MQFVQEDRIAFKKVGQKGVGNTVAPHGWQASTVVKAGEKSLVQVANRVYKPAKPGDWKLIGTANGISDPKHIHKGQTLKIPKKK
jgi:nucleoid-associated protein YgaU